MTIRCGMQSNKYKINITQCDHKDEKNTKGARMVGYAYSDGSTLHSITVRHSVETPPARHHYNTKLTIHAFQRLK